ncbi:18194_t:CDS:2, partial [Gigaspora rosea]
ADAWRRVLLQGASLDFLSSIPNNISILRPYGLRPLVDVWKRALLQEWIFVNISSFARDTDYSKQDILDAFVKVFKKISESSTNREKKKAKKIHDSAIITFQRKEIHEFFDDLDKEFSDNSSELLIKSGDLQTLNLSLHYNERSSELKRKYNSKEDEPSEISRKSKSYKIRSFKDESSISKTSTKDEIESQTYNPSSDSEYSIKAKAKGSYYLDYFIGPEENPQGLYEYFDDELWKCAFSEIRTQYPYINIPENVFDLCGNVVKVMNKFKAFNRKANKTSESSAQMMKKFDPRLAGSKPDFTIRTTNPKKFVELMKNNANKSLEDGVDLIICGLHVIGFLGRCYIIDLHYEGVYRMILIGEFKFPEDPTTWGSLMSCFQILATVQDLVNKGAIKYQYATRKGSNQEFHQIKNLKRKCFIPR